ncbi:MAG TPA: WecB/TagA/CpsF family glycosyltransferase [Trueperaceae bacterium]
MRTYVLGLPVDAVSLEEATAWVLGAIRRGKRPEEPGMLVVTLNPEIAVMSRADHELGSAIRHADLSVADGVGITWAARRHGTLLRGRVPGIDLVTRVLREGGSELSVYLLGGRPGVAMAAARAIEKRFGTRVLGAHHGYFRRPGEVEEVCAAVRASGAPLLLAGLGEGQEKFLHQHGRELGATVMIGVGGTLDVLAGTARRMPAWTTRLGVEWLFRVLLDPRRWRRIPRLWRFAWLVLNRRSV